MKPLKPFLVVRPGMSFWVHEESPSECTCTLSAFNDGVYLNALFLDSIGCLWSVEQAELTRTPSLADRWIPWRRVTVEIELQKRSEDATSEAILMIREILNGDSEFNEHLKVPISVLLKKLDSAHNPADIVEIARLAGADQQTK